MKLTLILVACVAVLLAARIAQAAPQHKQRASVTQLRTREARIVRRVEGAKRTVRWFERHPAPLYSLSPSTKRVAWRAVNLARQRIILGRAELARVRALIARQTLPPRPPHYRQWLCIHSHEARWNDPGSPYYGGLQMDLDFMRTYGARLLREKGTADRWTPLEQMQVAERAYRDRGFWPWPNTARYCGLL